MAAREALEGRPLDMTAGLYCINVQEKRNKRVRWAKAALKLLEMLGRTRMAKSKDADVGGGRKGHSTHNFLMRYQGKV